MKQISACCYTLGSCRITREQAVVIILNNRTTVPYLSLPACRAAPLVERRQQEFPSGPEECGICTKCLLKWGNGKPATACKINTPEAAVCEWEVPFQLDKDVGRAEARFICVEWCNPQHIKCFGFECVLADDLQDLTTNFFSVFLASLYIWVEFFSASGWEDTELKLLYQCRHVKS